MKATVVYESMYGNTHLIADAIAEGLRPVGEVRLGSVSEVPPGSLDDVDLLIVGGPTHVRGMSRTGTRRAAVETAAKDADISADPAADGPGLREWLGQLPDRADGYSAAFDTRIDKPMLLTGSAAKGIAKELRRHHREPLATPESFLVAGSGGPLREGEADRARQWAEGLADRLRERAGA